MLSIQEINQLIEKLDQSSIDEFSYEANGAKVKLKKNKGLAASPVPSQSLSGTTENKVQQSEVSVPKENEAEEEKITNEPQQTQDYDHEIVAPMVGTFYSSPSPDKPVYVQIGDKVDAESIVCIVEAMKLFNEIEADVNGTITEILVEDGELVEYGQPLFRIKQG